MRCKEQVTEVKEEIIFVSFVRRIKCSSCWIERNVIEDLFDSIWHRIIKMYKLKVY